MRDHWYFPGALEMIARVRGLEQERDQRRAQRLQGAHQLSPRAFELALEDVAERMKENAQKPPAERGGAFAVLSDDDLGVIERQLEDDEHDGCLKILRHRTESLRGLALLRTNLLAGRTIVNGPMFRQIARDICKDLIEDIRAFIRNGNPEQPEIVLVVPWRAGLIGAEVYQRSDIRQFWHFGVKRNEQTLEVETYFASETPSQPGNYIYLICDPMLATGNTPAAIIRRLINADIPVESIVNQALIAAPEGIFRLLHEFPGLRIVTLALDGRLDQRGYITDPGLGDFGDFALNDVDRIYAQARWLRPGLLTPPMVDTILGRTAEVCASLTVAAAPA